MKTLATLVIALHALYLLVPPARAGITEIMQSCPLAVLAGPIATISMGDRNGLNPR